MTIAIYWMHLGFVLLVLLASVGLLAFKPRQDLAEDLSWALIIFTLLPLFLGGLIRKFYLAPVYCYVLVFLLAAAGVWRLWRTPLVELKWAAGLACLLLAHLVIRMVIQIYWEYPVQGGDWFMHAVEFPARFLSGNWSPPMDRPGYYNLLLTSWLVLGQKSYLQYWFSQIVAVTYNSLLIWPAYLIARRFLHPREILLALVFMGIGSFSIYQSIYTWPKNLMAFFVLLNFYYLFIHEHKKSTWIISGICAALAYLSHPTGAFFVCAFALALMIKRQWQGLLVYLAISGLLLIPQLIWNYVYLGELSDSKLIYYPFATVSYQDVTQYSFNELFQRFLKKFPWEVLGIRLMHVLRTLTPFFFFGRDAQFFRFYDSWPGAVTIPIYLLFVYAILTLKSFPRIWPWRMPLAIFFLVPFGLTVFQWGYPHPGLMGQSMHAFVPISILLALAVVATLPDRQMKKTVLFILFAWALIQLAADMESVNRFYWLNERRAVWTVLGTKGHVIPGFDMHQLISAYYWLKTPVEKIIQSLIGVLALMVLLWGAKRLWLSDPETLDTQPASA